MTDDRYFIVVCEGPNSNIIGQRSSDDWAVSRRTDGPGGRFTGPWGLLTSDEAVALAEHINQAPEEGSAKVVEVFRWAGDPVWTDEYA